MGKRGPKPTHPDLVKLAGNPGKRAVKPVVRASGSAEIPEHLSEAAAAMWAVVLRAMPPNFYTSADLGILAAYCEAWALHKRAIEEIRENGPIETAQSGVPFQSPWVSILNKQATTMASLGDRLGLSPGARASLKVDVDEKPASKFDGLIGQTGLLHSSRH